MLNDCDTMNIKCYECTNIGTNNVIINHHNVNVVDLSDDEEYLKFIDIIFDNKEPLTNDKPCQHFSDIQVGVDYLAHSKQTPFVNDNEPPVNAVQPPVNA